MRTAQHSCPSPDHPLRCNRTCSELVFGHRTALQAARSMHDRRTLGEQPHSQMLPRTVPRRKELEGLLECLQAAQPHLSFDVPIHLLVESKMKRRPSDLYIPHLCRTELPRRSLIRLTREVAAAVPNLALCQLACAEDDALSLLLLLWEACGTYSTPLTSTHSRYDIAPLTSVRSLASFCMKNPSLRGARKVSRLLRYVEDSSASPRETALALLLGLPERHGGYNLGIPQMNYEVRASRQARAISGKTLFRCDLCWPQQRIDVEYQSRFAHEGETMRVSDSRRTNALTAMGWEVIGITSSEATSLPSMDTIANSVRKRLGKRKRPCSVELHAKRMDLRRRLDLIRK